MKMKMFLMLIFLGVGVSAQELTVEIKDFKHVEIDSGLKVNFLEAIDNKAVISGSRRDEVLIYSENDTLFITSGLRKIVKEKSALVNIYYTDLRSIEAAQSSEIEICGSLEQPEITIVVKEGANLFAELIVDNLKASALTGGTLNLVGKAKNQNIEVRAKGTFRGETLVGDNINVTIKGGGNASVNSIFAVDANVEAGGEVYIFGDPEKIVKNPGIAGTIQKIN